MSLDVEKPREPAPVQRFGDYVVEKRLAMGGMAEIYLARREGIEDFAKRVVLKRIRPELAAEPRFVRMFLDEARLAATLQHQNIAQVYDIGEDRGEYFFAMEYLDGVDARTILRRAIANEPLRLEIALGIASAIASGLHHAHEARGASGEPLGIVHRDISPSNVFITYDGAIKLMDFGIAKAQFREGRTGSGTLKGKAPYMSPEQIRGDSVDRRSDIFSLGVVLFELATSSRLFNGKTEFQIFRQIVSGKTPSPRALAPDMSPALAAIITKALARRPEKRYETALAFHRALDAFVARNGLRVGDFEIAEYVRKHFRDRDTAAQGTESLGASEESGRDLESVEMKSASRRFIVGAGLAALGVGLGWLAYDQLIDRESPAAAPIPAVAADPGDKTAVAAEEVAREVEPAALPRETDAAPLVSPAADRAKRGAKTRRARPARKSTSSPSASPSKEAPEITPPKRKWDPSSALPPPSRKSENKEGSR